MKKWIALVMCMALCMSIGAIGTIVQGEVIDENGDVQLPFAPIGSGGSSQETTVTETEMVTEPETVINTETETETETEIETEPRTEMLTETETVSETEPETITAAETATVVSDQEATPKGCGMVIGTSALGVVVTMAAAGIAVGKRKE